MYKVILILILTICCSKDSIETNFPTSLSQRDISSALEIHNKARAEVGVEKLEWSDLLSADAQKWADNLAENDKLFHSTNESRKNQGENLYYSYRTQNGEPKFSDSPAEDASSAWYNEIFDYKYAVIGSKINESVMIGHYTQMVWKSSTMIGIALSRSSSGKEYIVARYSPPGNYIGEYPY